MASDGDGTAKQVLGEIRTRLIAAVAASIVAGILAGVAAAWASVQGFAGNVGLVQAGAVMSFAAETCPTGWQPYKEGWGRVMVGAVSAEQLAEIPGGFAEDEDGLDLEARQYLRGGGTQYSVLELGNLPSHSHGIPRGRSGPEGDNLPFYATSELNLSGPAATELTPPQGEGSKPFGNMPPYIALTVCRKT